MSVVIDPNGLVDRAFLGVPYKKNGRSLKGADCVGLCMLYLAAHGVNYSDIDSKERGTLQHWYETQPARFVDAFLNMGALVRFADLRKFDVLLFFSSEAVSKFPTGMGIMVDSRHFLGVLREGEESSVRMLNIHWKALFWGAMRLHRVADKGLVSWD